MSRETASESQIEAVRTKANESRFLRYMVFSDIIQKYSNTMLKNKITWLKTSTLILIINRGGKLNSSQLARILLRSNYSITKLVDGLEKEGLVIRRRDSKDRRIYQVCVTPLGCEFIIKSFELMSKGEARINTCLTKEESQQLIELSRRVRLNLIAHITGMSEDKIKPLKS